jgi:hypothetical protein
VPAGRLGHVGDGLAAGCKPRVIAQRLAVRANGGEPAGRVAVGRPLVIEAVDPAAVFVRHVPLHVFVGLRLGGPGPAVAGDFAAVIEIVHQHKSLGQSVQVGRDIAAEEAAGGVAVALRQIAQHLVVGPVLLHDVDDVLDLLRLVGDKRNVLERVFTLEVRRRQAGIAQRPLGQVRQAYLPRHGDRRHRPLEQRQRRRQAAGGQSIVRDAGANALGVGD